MNLIKFQEKDSMTSRWFNWLFLIILIGLSISCSKKKEFLPIHKDADFVIKVNTSGIGEKLLFEKAKEFSWKDIFSFEEEDSVQQKNFWEKLLKNPGKAGIDYMAPIYFFQYKSELFLAAHLDNEEEFTEFIQKEKGKITSIENGFSNYTFSNISISWNKQVILFQLKNDKAILRELLTLKKDESVFNNPEFQKAITFSDDVVCFLHPTKLLPDNTLLGQLNLLNSSTVVRIGFEKGCIELNIDNLIQPESEKFLKELTPFKTNSTDTNYLASLQFNIEPSLLNRINENTGNKLFNEFGIHKEDLVNGLTGEFYGNVSTVNSGLKTFTTYEMDEDFNKVEITDTTVYYYPSFNIELPTQNIHAQENIVTRLINKGFLSKFNNGYVLDLLSFPAYVKLNNNHILIYDKISEIKVNTSEKIKIPEVFKFQFNLSENLYKIIPFNSEQIMQIKIKGSKEEGKLQFKGNILFKDKKQNSLLQLLEQFKEEIQKNTVL